MPARRRRRRPHRLAAPRRPPAAQDCPTSFLDAISGADSNTWLFRQGLKLAGAEDKLPNPNALPVTILVPSDKAWFQFFWRNGALQHVLSLLQGAARRGWQEGPPLAAGVHTARRRRQTPAPPPQPPPVCAAPCLRRQASCWAS